MKEILAAVLSTSWYVVPMNTVEDFNRIPVRTLEETWQMTKDPKYVEWAAANKAKAKELNWRPGTHKADGTCYACHPLKPETYQRLQQQGLR